LSSQRRTGVPSASRIVRKALNVGLSGIHCGSGEAASPVDLKAVESM
jgi:hypothetical protein